MATEDKHPPLDPRRHSTNKRVKALGENIFGTPVLTAEGSKRVRVGDKNTTSANMVPAGETVKQEADRLVRETEQENARKLEEALQNRESFLEGASRKFLKQGWRTKTDQELLDKLATKSNRA